MRRKHFVNQSQDRDSPKLMANAPQHLMVAHQKLG